jgi:hypothetical protein
MDLATYTLNVQSLLNDPLVQFYSSTNLTNWINLGRSEVAKRSMCVRRVTPSSTSLTAISITGAGGGYSQATVTISATDAFSGGVQATATAALSGGSVQSITLTNPGTGYVNIPTVTITGDGTGAAATASLGLIVTTIAGQEIYPFAAATASLLAVEPGIQGISGIMDVSVSWGAVKPTLQWYPWSVFQAYARSMNQGQSWPSIWSQQRLGETGNLFLFPIPAATYEMQWDCLCTPQALSGTQTVDVIPDNWTTAVFYYACHLAYLNAQRRDDANDMFQRYERSLVEASAYAQPPRTPTFYGMDG